MATPVSVRYEGSIAIVTIDNPPVNALSTPVREGLLAAIGAAFEDRGVAAVVVTGHGRFFVAGADVREMDQPPRRPFLSDVIALLDKVDKPVVAAINGAALGGGLEIALACDLRIAEPSATLGLPETRLGIVPGAGGTQRLPRLVGIERAASMIREGRTVDARTAIEIGLVDRLADSALDDALQVANAATKRRVSSLPVKAEPVSGTDTGGLRRASLPAALEADRLVGLAATVPFETGLAEERRAFLTLRDSAEAKALRHVFFAERASGSLPGQDGVTRRRIDRVGIVGAGTMGAAIAATFADAGFQVELVERDATLSKAGEARVAQLYERQFAAKRMTAAAVEQRLRQIHSTADWDVLAGTDIVVEAAFEKMEVKTEIFSRLDRVAKPAAILASNTSYLDIDALAAATSRPADVVGLHFFAPANVMKLVEVIRARHTAPEVLVTCTALARKLGKQPVIAGNAYGFIGNRIYSAYRRHAEYLMEDGASPYEIDKAMEAFGFAMGVFATSDLSGLDISYAMRRSLDATRDPAERYVAIADRLVEAGRLGRKSGVGYYSYVDGRATPDPVTEKIVEDERRAKGRRLRTIVLDAVQRRLLAAMANEGAAALEEGIASRASDIDVVLINGYGFPRHKGGPMWAADQAGLADVLAELEAAKAENPGSMHISPLLRRIAASGQALANWSADAA
jgi:3-hydroxyacyl-CoA dehydrogenase